MHFICSFKSENDRFESVVITHETIFHPQGGGQPTDLGIMTNGLDASFEV